MYLDKGNFKISERWFCKHVFLILSPVKNIYLSKSCIRNVCVELCKSLGKMVKITVLCNFIKVQVLLCK
jgi:hypothetical protein